MNDWEYEYNGLTLGGDDYGINKIEGLATMPDVRADEVEKPEDHGSYIFAKYLSKRTITIEADVTGDPSNGEFVGRLNALRAAFIPQEDNLPFTYQEFGSERLVYCKPTRLAMTEDPDYSIGYAQWAVQLEAEDPRIYDSGESIGTVEPYESSGVVFNLTFNVDFGGGSGGVSTVTNDGGFPTWPTLRIDGPVTDPRVRNTTLDKELRLNMTIASGEYVEIDTVARTVMLQGESSRYSKLDSTSQWWWLEPGVNNISFLGDSVGGTTLLTVTWRSAWI